ncbi:MAG: ASCH domain-containing protein [Sulfuritalea sp.]|nr:ASCH domain-containing protein [Sulfuritalea sp.]
MTNLRESLQPQAGKTIVLSIKPKYVDLILAGTKTVEFRRAWAAEKVDMIVLYASAPIQKIVGVAHVSDVVAAKPSLLWGYCKERGGGLKRSELFAYMDGKAKGFAILLGDVKQFDHSIAPSRVITKFSPPQSFRYMTATEVRKLEKIAMQPRPER